ncbi:MAG: hypothetical protein AAB551_00620 [Patescibacteria group bacterium]
MGESLSYVAEGRTVELGTLPDGGAIKDPGRTAAAQAERGALKDEARRRITISIIDQQEGSDDDEDGFIRGRD